MVVTKSPNESEEVIWEGSPDMVSMLMPLIFGILLFWLVFPIIYVLFQYIVIKSTYYKITNQRVRVKKGILNRYVDELELYRVRDMQVVQPFWYRHFNKGRIVIHSTDRTSNILELDAIPNAEVISDEIRQNVERLRGAKRRIV